MHQHHSLLHCEIMAQASRTLADDSPHKAEPPIGEKQSPLDGDFHGDSGFSSSWRNIFEHPTEGPPTLGLDFMRAVQHTTTTKYGLRGRRDGKWIEGEEEEATLTLGQDLGKLGLGAVVWDCGEDLIVFLGRHCHLVAGKRVLDLGTGTGIAGLAAAQCGAREVILTDHPALGPLVRSNADRNAGFSSSRATFAPLSWGNDTAARARKLAPVDEPFDLILASDCLYDPVVFPAFRQTLDATCGPRTVLVMAYKRRLDSREKEFFIQLEADFHLEVVGRHHRQPPVASSYGVPRAKAVASSNTSRGIFILLGARRGYLPGKGGTSPLGAWRVEHT